MQVRILFFGATADWIGRRATDFELANGATAAEAVDKITRSNKSFSDHKLLVAVNQEYVPSDTKLKDGDELAIFTAVSGG